MHIAVLAKAVPDYEVPAGDFELVNNRAHARYTRMIGLYDENALEVGIQLKEKYSYNVTVISYSNEDDIKVLRKAVAMGCDRFVLVSGSSDDPYVIAANLKMAIEKLGDVDLVLAGRQSADMDRGVVHGILAGMMGYPFIPQVSQIMRQDDRWDVNQITETGVTKMQFSGKAVISITDDTTNVPRIPPVRGILASKKMPVEKLPAIDSDKMGAEEVAVETPKMDSKCEFLPIEDMEQAALTLVKRLKEERYL
ncbi:Electron transfer flavoprotein domain protein [uncultured Desulfobacterium sp.]|uniref:Electron transfer flavoprotein domain protein n=1 Tax=uncultured Desulfobacterium sp. TaxID=201089 RepID=A0A445MWK4_9BACT|nr:Electron transfer flavoprotein domain protein [uncultured Desulfobacterium sp.]